MKKVLHLSIAFFLFYWPSATAQNVGIGTNAPQTNLHVANTIGSSIIRSQATADNTNAALELQAGVTANDFFQLRKWKSGSVGTLGGISVNGMSQLTTGSASAGPLLIGTETVQPFYLTTGNTVRMTIDAGGNIGMGAAPSDFAQLHVFSATRNGILARSTLMPTAGSFTAALQGRVSIASVRAAGVVGTVESGAGSSSPISNGAYGVLGTSIESGYGVGAFASSGANGIITTVISGSGKAIISAGPLQFTGIGEGEGRVLASDVSGNATWQLAGGTHTHYGQTWEGSAMFGLTINNLFSSDFSVAISGNSSNSSAFRTKGVTGSSASTTGIGVYGINTTGTVFPSPADNSGVSGVAGTGIGVFGGSATGVGVYGSSIDATSVYGQKGSVNGNAGHFYLSNASSTNAALKAEANGNNALEINNGYIKVGGANKTAFVITATAANSSGHILQLSYNNQSQSDIILVTHNYNPGSPAPTSYHNQAVGVYWNATNWAIYNEDTSVPILNKSFNVLVIKQ